MERMKAQLKRLMEQRSIIEAEIAQRSARLEAAGVGLQSPLVDDQGFPRADVDVAAIRADRHAIITLSNDHKALSRQMEQMLHALHALSCEAGGGDARVSTPTAEAAAQRPAAPPAAVPAAAAAAAQANGSGQAPAVEAAVAAEAGAPFAVIDELSAGSPAAEAGLQLNDQLCSFGDVTRQTPGTLQAVAALLQASEGRPVQAVVLRHGAPLALALTPRPWGGRGLLGCHLRPL